jgi:hypothetical protein
MKAQEIRAPGLTGAMLLFRCSAQARAAAGGIFGEIAGMGHGQGVSYWRLLSILIGAMIANLSGFQRNENEPSWC